MKKPIGSDNGPFYGFFSPGVSMLCLGRVGCPKKKFDTLVGVLKMCWRCVGNVPNIDTSPSKECRCLVLLSSYLSLYHLRIIDTLEMAKCQC